MSLIDEENQMEEISELRDSLERFYNQKDGKNLTIAE